MGSSRNKISMQTERHNKPRWETWANIAFSTISACIALWGVQHQIQTERQSRLAETEKANQERQKEWGLLQQSLENQIQLSKTNRAADFQIWRLEFSQQHSNWIAERDVDFSNQLALWHQQHFEEWTQYVSTLAAQQKRDNIIEKEKLYEDVVYHLGKFLAISQKLIWYSWHLEYFQDLGNPLPRGTSKDEAKSKQDYWNSQIAHAQEEGEKYSADYDQEKIEILRLMQEVKLQFAGPLSDTVDSGLINLDKLNVGLAYSPAVSSAIHDYCKQNSDAVEKVETFYAENIKNYTADS